MKLELLSLLLLAAVLSSFFCASLAKVSQTQVKNPGLFYIFDNGQVILLDAVLKRYVKTIRAFNETGIPFPNKCPGNPFNGTWNDQTLGIGKHTIFMSAAYAEQGSNRLSGLTDAVYVVDTETQEITARVNSLGRPVHIYYIPFHNSVWSHNDGLGTFTVIQASPPFDIIDDDTASPRIVVGHGKLMYDERLGSTGFKTSVTVPGGYVMDLSNPQNSVESTKYLNFSSMVPEEEIKTCGGTHGIGYSSVNNHVYFGCIPNSASPPGTIAVHGDTYEFVKFWNFTSGQLYTTPDHTFVIGLDSGRSIANVLYITPDNATHYPIQLKANSTPSYLNIYPKGDYYWAFISLTNSNEMAIIDFNGVIKCASASNCTSSALSSYVSYITMGYHNPPNAPDTLAKYRPMDAGHRYVCMSALYEKSVYCYDTTTETVDKYEGFEYIQRVVFVEGELKGAVPSENVSITYDCSTAPTKIMKISTSGAERKMIYKAMSLLSIVFSLIVAFM